MSETEKCKECGNGIFYIQRLYSGRSDDIFIVECSECKYHTIPVAIPYGAPQAEVSEICLSTWNSAQGRGLSGGVVDLPRQERGSTNVPGTRRDDGSAQSFPFGAEGAAKG